MAENNGNNSNRNQKPAERPVLNTEAITKEVILTIEQLLQVKNRHQVIKGKAIVWTQKIF